jgi:hypothetical protein
MDGFIAAGQPLEVKVVPPAKNRDHRPVQLGWASIPPLMPACQAPGQDALPKVSCGRRLASGFTAPWPLRLPREVVKPNAEQRQCDPNPRRPLATLPFGHKSDPVVALDLEDADGRSVLAHGNLHTCGPFASGAARILHRGESNFQS